jgi:hypothetical protein
VVGEEVRTGVVTPGEVERGETGCGMSGVVIRKFCKR